MNIVVRDRLLVDVQDGLLILIPQLADYVAHFEAHPIYKPFTKIFLQNVHTGKQQAVISNVSFMDWIRL